MVCVGRRHRNRFIHILCDRISARIQQYQSDIEAYALNHQFQFIAVDSGVVIEKLSGFNLFLQGHAHQVQNIITGPMPSGNFHFFDHSYLLTGNRILQSVVIIGSKAIDLPVFTLEFNHTLIPENDGLKFALHPTFSNSYALKGDDEAKLRQIFQPRVLEFFEATEGLRAEGFGNQLLVYRYSHRADIKATPELLELCEKLMFHLTSETRI